MLLTLKTLHCVMLIYIFVLQLLVVTFHTGHDVILSRFWESTVC